MNGQLEGYLKLISRFVAEENNKKTEGVYPQILHPQLTLAAMYSMFLLIILCAAVLYFYTNRWKPN